MGTVGCYQQNNEISSKLNECAEDSDRIVYLQEEALEKKRTQLGKFDGNCQNADSALECISPVNQGNEKHQVRFVACCTEDDVGVPIELNDYHSGDVAGVFYLMEEAIDLEITVSRETYQERSPAYQEKSPGGFYEVGTLPVTEDGDTSLQKLMADVQPTRDIDVDLQMLGEASRTLERSVPLGIEFLDLTKPGFQSSERTEDQSNDSEASLIIQFRSGDDIFPVCFTHRPIGITCSNIGAPVKVERVIPGSAADTLGVMPGWSFRMVGETDVSHMEWMPFLECLKRATDVLHWS